MVKAGCGVSLSVIVCFGLLGWTLMSKIDMEILQIEKKTLVHPCLYSHSHSRIGRLVLPLFPISICLLFFIHLQAIFFTARVSCFVFPFTPPWLFSLIVQQNGFKGDLKNMGIGCCLLLQNDKKKRK